MIQYYSTKQYFHFDCIVLLYVLYNTLMIVVKMSTSYVISTYHICIIMLSPYSTSQNEWIAVIPIPLTPDNSCKHSCWLWIHDVSCLYPILLPCKDTQLTLLSDVYVSTIDLNHLMLTFEYIDPKLPVTKIYVVVAYLLYCMYIIMIPNHTNRYRVEIKYTTHILLYTRRTCVHIRTDASYALLQIVHTTIILSFRCYSSMKH